MAKSGKRRGLGDTFVEDIFSASRPESELPTGKAVRTRAPRSKIDSGEPVSPPHEPGPAKASKAAERHAAPKPSRARKAAAAAAVEAVEAVAAAESMEPVAPPEAKVVELPRAAAESAAARVSSVAAVEPAAAAAPEPAVAAAPAAQQPASAVQPDSQEESLSEIPDAPLLPRLKATVRVWSELVEEARHAVSALSGPPLHLTYRALLESALRHELERLRRAYNAGRPFGRH